MRRVLASVLALGVAATVSGAAWAECAGHVKQQSVQAPTTSTTTATTAPVSKPKG